MSTIRTSPGTPQTTHGHCLAFHLSENSVPTFGQMIVAEVARIIRVRVEHEARRLAGDVARRIFAVIVVKHDAGTAAASLGSVVRVH
jgi:hypothetical protein